MHETVLEAVSCPDNTGPKFEDRQDYLYYSSRIFIKTEFSEALL